MSKPLENSYHIYVTKKMTNSQPVSKGTVKTLTREIPHGDKDVVGQSSLAMSVVSDKLFFLGLDSKRINKIIRIEIRFEGFSWGYCGTEE